MVFLLLDSVLFLRPLTFFIVMGGIGGRGGIKMASANSQSANELILVRSTQPHLYTQGWIQKGEGMWRYKKKVHLIKTYTSKKRGVLPTKEGVEEEK